MIEEKIEEECPVCNKKRIFHWINYQTTRARIYDIYQCEKCGNTKKIIQKRFKIRENDVV